MTSPFNLPARGVEAIHGRHVAGRRVRVLSDHLAARIPAKATVLDVGAGDGLLAAAVAQRRPDVMVRGVDVLVRPNAAIPVEPFDGVRLPFGDGAFEVAMLVDVLHHCEDPTTMLAEAARVASRAVVLKDHSLRGFAARPTLRLMDWVGNRRHGVALPYNYLTPAQWDAAFAGCGLRAEHPRRRLGLYPRPAGWLFDRSLHFVARLEKVGAACVGRSAPS